MPRKTYRTVEIVGILKGKSAADCFRDKGICEAVYYRRKKEYADLHPDQARRLKELEKENNRLKKLLAEVMLDNQILKDINSGNF